MYVLLSILINENNKIFRSTRIQVLYNLFRFFTKQNKSLISKHDPHFLLCLLKQIKNCSFTLFRHNYFKSCYFVPKCCRRGCIFLFYQTLLLVSFFLVWKLKNMAGLRVHLSYCYQHIKKSVVKNVFVYHTCF